jgi:pimeloyl-ACP methyl ester carboxylesterase
MLNRSRRIALAMVALLAVLGWRWYSDKHPAAPDSAATAKAAVRKFGTLAFTPCTLAPELGVQTVEAQCSSLEVLENRAAPGGRKIRLAIAWVPAKGEAAPDPVFMLAGGPGQSALESFPNIASAFDEARKHRDVILVDQRGTGGSNQLRCQEPPTAAMASAPEASTVDPDAKEDSIATRAFAERCLRVVSSHADVRYYTTTDAIQDLDDVRHALGADKVNLVGVSYGTRVAQQYAKRYPAHTRTVTLDGVVPNSLVLGNEFAGNLEDSLDRQFARCAKDKACAEKLGDPRARLTTLLTTLKTSPPRVRYRDAITGESREETLTAGHVTVLARMFAYAPQAAALLPLVLNEAAHDRYEPLMALAHLLSSSLGKEITQGMQLSVICTEDAAELKADPSQSDSLLGNALVDALRAQCPVWPHGVRPDNFRSPLTGPVPVLLLSGEFDPVTPPRYGDEVAKSLTNARHLIVRGQGHNVLPIGCVPRLFASFLDQANAKTLDAECLKTVPYAPQFIGFYGWDP